MLSDLILLIVTSAIAVLIALVIGISPGVKLLIKISFALTALSLALWNISIYIADSVQTNLMLWNNLAFFWPTVAAISSLIFVTLLNSFLANHYLSRPKRLPKWVLVAIAAAALQFIAIGSDRIFNKIIYDTHAGSYVFERGIFYPVYILGLIILLGIMVFRIVNSYRKSGKYSRARESIMAVIIALIATVLYSLVTNVIIPVATNSQKYIGLGMFASDIFSFGLAISIIRYHLLDIRFYAWLASAYLSTLFIVTFLFIAPFILAINYVLKTNLTPVQLAVIVILSVCLLYLLQYLHRFFDRLTAQIFFRRYYDPQDVLDKLGAILVRTADLSILRDKTALVMQEALKTEWFKYFLLVDDLNGEDKTAARRIDAYCTTHKVDMVVLDEIEGGDELVRFLRERDIAAAIRLHTTHGDMGYMVMGHKRSGEKILMRDKRLLNMAADEIAISLQNVLRFEEIKRFNVTLQDEVTTATKKLKKQNQRLEELDNIKDDFISMASHQLRTPLTSVKGYLSMVLEGDAGTLNATQEQMLKQAFTSSQRMVFLITDLLNVSRLKTGKFIIDATPTNLGDVVEQELDQLRETAQAKNITISYDRPTNFPELMIDEVKIRQVIMNFVDNAIYYTREGGRINVELNDLRLTVELRVTDNGIGVPKSEQHHLFTKFYRATNARKARPDGTGLGLFMAQKVVVAQGGAIIFTSKEGVGSTFGFTLPKAKLAVHEQGKPEDGEKTVAVSPTPKPHREVTTK